MILECGCGKLYRVRDGTAHAGMICADCGGPLRPSGQAPSIPGEQGPATADENGRVRCPTCGDHFQVQAVPPKETPRPSGPCCPKCGALLSLETMLSQESGIGWVGQERMWYCPRCLSVLGFTAWKR